MKYNKPIDESKITKEQILNLLEQLNQKLEEAGKHGEILMAGGAVMTMVLEARDSTHDIDAIFHPKEDLRKYIAEISSSNGVHEDWLNDGVKGFLTPQMTRTQYKEYSNLSISHIDVECILAMKLVAARSEKDMSDALFLMKALEIKEVDQLYDLVEKYTDKNQQTPRSYFFTQEAFGIYKQNLCEELNSGVKINNGDAITKPLATSTPSYSANDNSNVGKVTPETVKQDYSESYSTTQSVTITNIEPSVAEPAKQSTDTKPAYKNNTTLSDYSHLSPKSHLNIKPPETPDNQTNYEP